MRCLKKQRAMWLPEVEQRGNGELFQFCKMKSSRDLTYENIHIVKVTVCACVHMCAQSCVTLCHPMTVHNQDPLFMGFFSRNTGVGCHFFRQRIFLTQGSNLCLLPLLHCQEDSLPVSHRVCT